MSAGKIVEIHYTLRLTDGSIIENSHGGAPFTFLHGAGHLVPGLEKALHNAHVGDRFSVSIPPEDGYGVSNPALITRVARHEFPARTELVVGAKCSAEIEGRTHTAWVVDILADEIILSFNHPLADETLVFAVEIISIRDARPSEMRHGTHEHKSASETHH